MDIIVLVCVSLVIFFSLFIKMKISMHSLQWDLYKREVPRFLEGPQCMVGPQEKGMFQGQIHRIVTAAVMETQPRSMTCCM